MLPALLNPRSIRKQLTILHTAMKPKFTSRMVTKWDSAAMTKKLWKNHGSACAAHILRLPDELLIPIIEYATSGSQYGDCNANDHEIYISSIANALALSCRRLNRIIQPYVYHTIHLGTCSIAPASERARSLHRTLLSKPDLGLFCRVLKVHVPDHGSTPPPQEGADYDLAHDMLTKLPNIVCCQIWGGFARPHVYHTWTLLRHVLHGSRSLKHLTLEKMQKEPALGDILMNVMEHNIISLTINGICDFVPWARSNRYLLDEDVCLIHLYRAMELKQLTCQQRKRTAAIESLSIHGFSEDTDTLRQFLLFPRALKHFKFTSIHENQTGWTIPAFAEYLSPFENTLKTLHLGWLADVPGQSVDLSAFSALEKLCLGTDQLNHVNADDASLLLLAPKLTTFEWRYDVEGFEIGDWRSLGLAEQTWNRTFASRAIAMKAALRTIRFVVNPDYECYNPAVKDAIYPWDFLDELHDDFAEKGISIEYTKPVVTKGRSLSNKQKLGASSRISAMKPRTWYKAIHRGRRAISFK